MMVESSQIAASGADAPSDVEEAVTTSVVVLGGQDRWPAVLFDE
jgi:hypothetical protein